MSRLYSKTVLWLAQFKNLNAGVGGVGGGGGVEDKKVPCAFYLLLGPDGTESKNADGFF